MKQVMVFQAPDGARFDDPDKCREHEALLAEVEAAVAPLGPDRPVHGAVYRQRDRAACLQAKRNLLAIVRRKFSPATFPVLQHPDDDIHPMSSVGRIIDDTGGPLCKAWNRLMRINWDNFREYEQPYFALNPDKATEPEPA